jgi:hypothetical protein
MSAIRKAAFNQVTSRLAGQRSTCAFTQSVSPQASGYRLVFSNDFDMLDLSTLTAKEFTNGTKACDFWSFLEEFTANITTSTSQHLSTSVNNLMIYITVGVPILCETG